VERIYPLVKVKNALLVVGSIILTVRRCTKGTDGPKRFGRSDCYCGKARQPLLIKSNTRVVWRCPKEFRMHAVLRGDDAA